MNNGDFLDGIEDNWLSDEGYGGSEEPTSVEPNFNTNKSKSNFTDDVESRLELAQYYKLLLNDSLFSNDNSSAAQQVDNEIREFVRGRLEVLVGLKSEVKIIKDPPLFTEAEVMALKAVAAKILKQPNITKPVKKAETKLNKVDTTKRGRPHKVEQPKEEPKPQTENKEDIKEVNGRLYKRVTAPDGRVMDLDVTPQVKPEGHKSMPTGAAMEVIMQQKAMEQMANMSGLQLSAATAAMNTNFEKKEQ